MSEAYREFHEAGLIAALSRHFDASVKVQELQYLYGGGSRILGRFTATVGADRHRLVFRLDPQSSFVESDRAIEFAALEFLQHSKVPVPRPLMLDAAGEFLGAPCFIMSEVGPGTASGFFDTDPYGDHRGKVGNQVFAMLGTIAAAPVSPDMVAALGDPGPNPAQTQLDHWVRILDADETSPQPIVRAGIQALRRRMPEPCDRFSIVHGDFRSGNFMIDASGDLVAILDWEFVHLGDPLEDLAWCFDPLWGHRTPDLAGGMIPHQDAISAWESTSSLKLDPVRFDWWRLFSAVKAMAMWTSSTNEFLREDGGLPGMAFPAMTCAPVNERTIAETLDRWGDS